MFLGEYSHSLDDKGRVVMPAKFRTQLDDGCVITKGQDRCLYVFPADQWEQEAKEVLARPTSQRRSREYKRIFFSAASDQTLDRAGRCQIPETLRSYADLGKDVTVVGVADRIEIWNPATWVEFVAEGDAYYADIEEDTPSEDDA